MKKKNIIIALSVFCVLSACIYGFLRTNINDNRIELDKTQVSDKKEVQKNKVEAIIKNKDKKVTTDNKVIKNDTQENNIKTANLYSDIPSSAIPLSAISKISDSPDDIQNIVGKIAENNNIYMIQKANKKLFIVSDNPENIRHSVEFTEVSVDNGHQTHTTFGYNDRIQDSDNDIWEIDPETSRPTRHTKYNKDGDVEFTEVWNYNPDEQIKYEMKDSNNKVISLRKETLQNGTDLRIEHLIYDKDGNTKMNVSITYEGEDIKRFTYYNANKPAVGGSIFSDYSDGLKVKETVYTSDLKPQETYTATYKDGVREDIIKWDNQNNEVEKLIKRE